MNCGPRIEDINDLIKDLNKTNDLFKLVRIMRERFQAAELNGKNLPSSILLKVGYETLILFTLMFLPWFAFRQAHCHLRSSLHLEVVLIFTRFDVNILSLMIFPLAATTV